VASPAPPSRPVAMAKLRAGSPVTWALSLWQVPLGASGCSATQLDAGKPRQATGTKCERNVGDSHESAVVAEGNNPGG
jgi:hypothetical protein